MMPGRGGIKGEAAALPFDSQYGFQFGVVMAQQGFRHFPVRPVDLRKIPQHAIPEGRSDLAKVVECGEEYQRLPPSRRLIGGLQKNLRHSRNIDHVIESWMRLITWILSALARPTADVVAFHSRSFP